MKVELGKALKTLRNPQNFFDVDLLPNNVDFKSIVDPSFRKEIHKKGRSLIAQNRWKKARMLTVAGAGGRRGVVGEGLNPAASKTRRSLHKVAPTYSLIDKPANT